MAKLSKKQFELALRESGGIYSATVKYIKAKFNVEITRQSVRDRALKNPKLLEDIRQEAIDAAEFGMMSLTGSKNQNVKYRACKFILNTIGKERGYVERIENINIDKTDLDGLTEEEIQAKLDKARADVKG